VGLLPTFAAGVGITADVLRIWRFRLELGGAYFFDAATQPPAPRGIVGLSAASVTGCVDVLRARRVALGACGSAWLGAIHAVVYDLPQLGPRTRAWVGLAAGLRVTWRPVGPLAVELGVDGVAPVTRYEFYVLGTDAVVFRQTAGASAFAAVGLHFP
jgi:hypothetical protein